MILILLILALNVIASMKIKCDKDTLTQPDSYSNDLDDIFWEAFKMSELQNGNSNLDRITGSGIPAIESESVTIMNFNQTKPFEQASVLSPDDEQEVFENEELVQENKAFHNNKNENNKFQNKTSKININN